AAQGGGRHGALGRDRRLRRGRREDGGGESVRGASREARAAGSGQRAAARVSDRGGTGTRAAGELGGSSARAGVGEAAAASRPGGAQGNPRKVVSGALDAAACPPDDGPVSELSVAPETPAARPRPWMTWSLLAVVLAIAVAIQLDGSEKAAIRWGWQPAFEVWRGKPWALLTSPLVHVELWHLAFNLYWLWILGRPVEGVLGPLRMAGFVLASALVSSAAQLAWSDQTGIGLSGVGYALFGLAWILSTRRPDLGIQVSRQTVRLFGIWFLFGVFATHLGLVNFGNAAHLFGAIFGMGAGFAFVERWKRAALAGLGTLLTAAALVSVLAPWSPTWNA